MVWINWRLAALIQQMVMVLELRGCLNHGLLLLFLRYSTLDWAKGKRKDCAFMGILKNFSIFNKDIKSLL